MPRLRFRANSMWLNHVACRYPKLGVHPLRNCPWFGQGDMEIRAFRTPEGIARETIA